MADQVTIKDIERRAIAHYVKETDKQLTELRDNLLTDLSFFYMRDKRMGDDPTYHREYIRSIANTLNQIKSDLDKVSRRTLWESKQ